jgi:hypothetical protein
MQDEFESALLFATIGTTLLIGELLRSVAWGAGPTIGLLMLGLALRFLISGLRQRETPRLPAAKAVPQNVDDVTLLMKQIRRA